MDRGIRVHTLSPGRRHADVVASRRRAGRAIKGVLGTNNQAQRIDDRWKKKKFFFSPAEAGSLPRSDDLSTSAGEPSDPAARTVSATHLGTLLCRTTDIGVSLVAEVETVPCSNLSKGRARPVTMNKPDEKETGNAGKKGGTGHDAKGRDVIARDERIEWSTNNWMGELPSSGDGGSTT